jgi:hypothetical protein
MTTTMTTAFDRPAKVFQAISAAKLHNELQVLPEPSVLEDMLGMLVSVGVLTAEQAHELWKLLEGGVAYPLPPMPRPDRLSSKADFYQIIRAATLIPRESAEFSVAGDVVVTVTTAIVNYVIDHFGDDIEQAASDVWNFITGLFSG